MAASDSGSEDDFVTYGTPLEPLEEDEPLKKPIRLQDQTVKDEKGRFQRFHGAFTGGFSAGYFNTAGSKEGWAPSTFVSSRHQKAEKQIFKPEDFMDEEDLGEHGIAPKEIMTTDDFSSKVKDRIEEKARALAALSAPIPGATILEDLVAAAKDLGEHGIAPKEIMTTDDFSSKVKDRIEEKARALAALSAPIPGATILEDLVAAAKISVGVQLLRKMGWKEGQGVGPRVKRKPQKQKPDTDMKFYGCPLPPESSYKSENEDDDDYAPENVTFAPKDIMPIDFTPKEGLHGLGYRGLDPKQALSGGLRRGHFNVFSVGSERASSLLGDDKHRRNRKGGVLGQAFGVGALEEEDDDIYNTDSLSRYDTTLGEEEPGDGMYGWTAPQEYTKKKKGSNKDASYVGKILEGFTLASIPAFPKKVYHPPELPRDYRPVHYFRPVLEAGSASSQVVQVLLASGGQMNQDAQHTGRHQMNAVQRRELLGETALQGPSSVFDLLSSKDKERIKELKQAAVEKQAAAATAAGRVLAQQGLSSRFQTPAVDEALSAWQNISVESASAFKPFEKNPEKQGRYDEYITQLKQGRKDALESSMDQHMTEWERGRERDEFIRAAMLYKPNNSTLACRFTRGKHEEDADKVDVPRDQENDTDDKTAAVKMKMFGKLTRDSFEWHPDKLLCKRFNIPDPYPGSSSVGMLKVKRDKYSVFNFLTVPESTMPTAQGVKPELSAQSKPSTSENASKPSEPGRRSRWDVSAQEKEGKDPISQFLSLARNEAAAEKQGSPSSSNEPEPGQKEEPPIEEEEEESRPPMDLFKAIFACSSDDKSSSSEEDSEEEEEEQKKPEEDPGLRQTTEPPVQETLPDTIQGQDRSLSVTPGSAVHEKHKKKCKEKHKAKKEHKHKKEKKDKTIQLQKTAPISRREMSTDISNIDPLALDEDIQIKKGGKKETASWEHQELSQILIKVIRGHSDEVSCCHFCFEDSKILTCSHDKTAKLWDIANGAPLQVYDGGHSAPIIKCALTPDNKRLFTASWDKTVKAWDVETGCILWAFFHDGIVTSFDVSSDGKYVVSGSDAKYTLNIIDAETGTELCHLEDCSFSPNGRYLCTASWDKTLRLWDIKTGQFRTQGAVTLDEGHAGNISSCVFSKDSSVLVSGSYDKTVIVWDMAGACKKLVLKGHADWVTDVDISSDKKWILSSSKDSTVRLWNIENSDHIPAVIETRKAKGLKIVKEWQDELASMAQDWADVCGFEHGHPMRDKLPFNGIGQNLNKFTSTNPARLNSLVWARTQYVGCGYLNGSRCPGMFTYVVCNYGPM
ncbi:UNVERIFIED_CONTAM: hypothetical protein FKN15_046997 [Acipenser sinensis]